MGNVQRLIVAVIDWKMFFILRLARCGGISLSLGDQFAPAHFFARAKNMQMMLFWLMMVLSLAHHTAIHNGVVVRE